MNRHSVIYTAHS